MWFLKWLLYLMMSPLLTPGERQTLKLYYQQQRQIFKEKHFIADMPPELEELERQLDAEEDAQRRSCRSLLDRNESSSSGE